MAESTLLTIQSLVFSSNQDPDNIAVESPGSAPLTYRDLRKQVLYVVTALNSQQFQRNDRIALIVPPGPEMAVMMVAVMAGFSCVPLNPHDTKPDYERNFSRIGVKALVVQTGTGTAALAAAEVCNLPVITLIPTHGKAGKFVLDPAVLQGNPAPEFASPSDISHVLLTSGTTALPKIVPISQKQSVMTRYRQVKALHLTADDRCLQMLPYFHGMGFGIPVLAILLAGGTAICPRDFIPSDFNSLLTLCRPTFFIAGPAHHHAILREMRKVPPPSERETSLRLILSSAAVMPDTVRREMESVLKVPVIEQYASTETGVISVNLPPKKGSVGIPVIDHLLILNRNGIPAGPLEQGEVLVRGETVFSGYEDAPEENAAAFTDGWFKTGDLGYLDNDGYLYLTGRKKELINKGGEKIAPEEIDTLLRSHPGVMEAMTFLIEDPVLGEDIAAMVVRKQENLTEHEIRRFLLNHVTPSKIPCKIYFVAEIPKTATGKPVRIEGTRRYS